MPSFKYYNIQVLPLDKKVPMIGSVGYKKIFESLKKTVDSAIEAKEIRSISHELRNDFFIAPVEVVITEDIAYGSIMKYDEVTTVFGTLDNKEKYVSSGGDSSKKYIYRFIFDFAKHILAIELAKGLPSSNVFIEALETSLHFHKEQIFPAYTLKVIEMTNAENLALVIDEAVSYKKVEVDVTFSNSEDWSDAIEEEILKEVESEMKEKQVDSLVHIEKSAKDSVMSLPTKIAMTYLGLACKFGNAIIRYKDKTGKTETFKMTDHPITLSVKETENNKLKSALDFALDVKASINDANNLAMNAKEIFNSFRKGINNEQANQ